MKSCLELPSMELLIFLLTVKIIIFIHLHTPTFIHMYLFMNVMLNIFKNIHTRVHIYESNVHNNIYYLLNVCLLILFILQLMILSAVLSFWLLLLFELSLSAMDICISSTRLQNVDAHLYILTCMNINKYS